MPTTETRDRLAFAMYLVDFEAEHIPGNPQDLCTLATRWGSFRASPDSDVSYIAESYYALADRMLAHWNRDADRETIARCSTLVDSRATYETGGE